MNPLPARFRLTTAALAGLLCTVLPAAPTSSSSDAPTSSAYTNQPLPPPIIEYSNNSIGNSFSDYGFSSSSSSAFASSTYYYPQNYFYFPPAPPPLGGTLPRRSPAFLTFANRSADLSALAARLAARGAANSSSFLSFVNRPSSAIPITPQLTPYVGEIFYPPLATHLHHEDLTRKQHQRLTIYRGTRAELLAALHARLDALREAEPAARARELAAFAVQQAPSIDAFEQEAEAIRSDLESGGFFRSGVDWADWDANRSWRLGDDVRYESRIDEFKVIRAAAYFYPNLIPAQRRLLQELALELNEPLAEPTADIALDAPDAYFYLSPETARVHLPKNLPEDLSAKIAAYQKEKSALKEELRSAIYKLDRSFFNFTRKSTLHPLAEQQAPRIAALETLAEDIRQGLAAQANPNRLHRPVATNETAVRIGAYTRERQQLLRAMQDKLAATQKAFPSARIEFNRAAAASKIVIIPGRQQSRAEAQALPAYQAELALFNDEQARNFAALDRTKSALRADVVKAAGASASGPGRPSVDAMINQFALEYQQHEFAERYSDYDTAVFEPGLSPGQRRLLYAAALQKLELPIPGGSRQP